MFLYDSNGKKIQLSEAEEKVLETFVACIPRSANFSSVIDSRDLSKAGMKIPLVEYLDGYTGLLNHNLVSDTGVQCKIQEGGLITTYPTKYTTS